MPVNDLFCADNRAKIRNRSAGGRTLEYSSKNETHIGFAFSVNIQKYFKALGLVSAGYLRKTGETFSPIEFQLNNK